MTVGAILLAAGSARRMGEDKLLADLGGKPLVLHSFDAIEAAGLAGPIVAIAPGSIVGALIGQRAILVEVDDHASGLAHSLAAAVAHIPAHWTAVIVCLADMPFVRPATLTAISRLASRSAIVRPYLNGRPGNPLLWGCDHFDELRALRGDEGGRTLLGRLAAERIDCNDPGIAIDIDTPAALSEARALLSSR